MWIGQPRIFKNLFIFTSEVMKSCNQLVKVVLWTLKHLCVHFQFPALRGQDVGPYWSVMSVITVTMTAGKCLRAF